MGRFVSAVLAQNEDVWTKLLPQQANMRYEPPRLVLFSGVDRSGCGTAQAAMGPFYCPPDKRGLSRPLLLPGDAAQARRRRRLRLCLCHRPRGRPPYPEPDRHPAQGQCTARALGRAEANEISVRIELQADCFAGVWAHNIQAMGRIDQGDVEEAMRTAAAIGDDMLQKASRGQVVPDSFTHGSSAQRKRWFNTGLQDGLDAELRHVQGAAALGSGEAAERHCSRPRSTARSA